MNGWLRVFYRNIIITLKERIIENNFFLEIKILLLEKLLNQLTVRSPVEINTIFFIESMAATLFVIKIDALLQRKDGSN